MTDSPQPDLSHIDFGEPVESAEGIEFEKYGARVICKSGRTYYIATIDGKLTRLQTVHD